MDYEGTKRNVGPPGHPYGAACVAILERDGGMSSMCRGRASIFRDDYLEIRENRVTHTHTHTQSHRRASRVSLFIFTEIRKGRPLFFRGWSALFRIRTFAPLPPLGAVSPPPCASDGSSRSAASPLLCRRGGRGGRAPTHDFDGKKLTIKNMTIWKN